MTSADTARGLRHATVVFCDLKGSTALSERLDPETMRALLARYFDELGAVHAAYGGTIAKIIGDALVAVFEGGDDAPLRATSASVAAVATLEKLNEEFEQIWRVRIANRTGIASGALLAANLAASTDTEVLAGDVVNIAETLESQAPPMGVLVDRATRERLGEAATTAAFGPVARKGRPGDVKAWLVESVTCSEVAFPPPGTESLTESRDTRRTVTIIFADPAPTTPSGEPPDGKLLRIVTNRFVKATLPIVERHGGVAERFIGDSLMAVFGLPVRNEDDAVRAVRAAAEIRAAIAELNAELGPSHGVQLRCPIGVNTGPVVAGDAAAGQRLVTGDTVNVAARLQQSAAPGEVFVGDLTRRLVGDVATCDPPVALSLKGKSTVVHAHRLVSIANGTGRDRNHHALIGRVTELQTIRDTAAAAFDTRRAKRATIVGDTGVGKTRLTYEFLANLDPNCVVLRGSCLSYGDGITFWPLLLVIHAAAGIGDDDDAETARARIAALRVPAAVRDRLHALAGLSDTPFAVRELVWAMRRLLEALAASNPLVVLIEDIQWAEPTLVDALDELTTTVAAPVLFLCSSRPATTDEQQQFIDGAATIRLEPLSPAGCRAFLCQLLGGSVIDDRAAERLADAADGNPLFLEQLVAMLVDVGRLRRRGDRWALTGELTSLELPASIEALLAARVDHLPADAKRTTELASVIGRRFEHSAVASLANLADPALLDDSLTVLERRELTHRIDDGRASAFLHQLIRDVTYNGMLKATRAQLHERVAAWLVATGDELDRGSEVEEIQGFHLEQAYHYRVELAPIDDHALVLGEHASEILRSAGMRALERGDMPAAASLLTRASRLLPDDHRTKAAILIAAGNALHETGAIDEAMAAFDAAEAAATAAHDDSWADAARIERLRLQYLSGRIDDPSIVHEHADRAIASLAEGDPDALSRAWRLKLNVEIAACRWDAAQRAANEVMGHASAAGNRLLAVRTLPLLALLAEKGPAPVPVALDTCAAIMDKVADDQESRAVTQLELASLAAMGGDLTRARALCAEARATLTELGWEMRAALVSLNAGPIELLADEPARAEAELRLGYDALRALDERNFISLVAALLADAVYRLDRFDEARQLLDEAQTLAAADDLAVHIVAGAVDAKCEARAGRFDRALKYANEAIGLVDGTQDPSGQADARLALAEVHALAGNRDAAIAAVADATERYGEKGNVLGSARAARLGDALQAASDLVGTRLE